MIVTQKINMNLDEHSVLPWIDAVQGDAYTRKIELSLFSGGEAWEIPADVQVLVQFQKSDGYGGTYDTLPDGSAAGSISGSVVTVVLIPQMLTTTGLVRVNVSLIKGIAEISTFEILINVHPNAGAAIAESEDYYNVSGFLPMPISAAAGQYIRVAAVDEQGIVRDVETAGIGDGAVDVPTNQSCDLTALDSTVTRYSFYVGSGPITLGEYSQYRINKIGVMADPGSTVRFALFEVQRNEDNTGILTPIAAIGDAVADSETGLASLIFEEGYYVSRDNTVIMALAEEEVIQCYQVGSSLVALDLLTFDDADYFDIETGTEIPCDFTTAETAGSSDIWFSLCVCDIDFITDQTLEQYIRSTAERLAGIDKKIEGILPTITILDNGKVVTVVDGEYELAEPTGGGGLPSVTADDNGKFLRVVDGAAAWVAVTSAEEASF